ncbi:MAG: hypothetical protein PHP26_07825 [Syntrophomonas sp.]|uniref:hypothetical protein n=1 Tax=Syntrophomonas sp. TaxID=2053627 RepID=UPI002614262E|nr:hypothetical protein [Syntrophomonas sp.]MDD3879882.1 hypothetical protein [Syntrophomonas sp.]MDD4627378.1 hypothetical protein [Syntrophomonas sp.]
MSNDIMSDEIKQDDLKVLMFNPFKAWKNMYFVSEEALTAITRKAVETTMFANSVDVILNSYLQYLKLQNEVSNYIAETLPFSSHRDTARVAKMLTALENKVDHLDEELFTELYDLKEDTAAILESITPVPANVSGEVEAGLAEQMNQQIKITEALLDKISGLELAMEEMKASLLELKAKPKPAARKSKKTTTE